jgi:hypothetical protein
MGDYDYPFGKPIGTYRILLLGRSYLCYVTPNADEQKCMPCADNKMAVLAKRLELTLNTLGALEDSPFHYEVFDGSKVMDQPLYLWPYYVDPPIVQKYDMDLTIVMMDPSQALNTYFVSPINSEGIPTEMINYDFMLKPNEEKFKSGPLHDFFELCKAKKLISISADKQWALSDLNAMVADPEVRKPLVDLIGKPLEMFREKLDAIQTASGNSHHLLLCLFPVTDVYDGDPFVTKGQRLFWKELCLAKKIPFLDICDDFNALRFTYFPIAGDDGGDHFDANGHALLNTVLSHALLKQKLIPFEATKP